MFGACGALDQQLHFHAGASYDRRDRQKLGWQVCDVGCGQFCEIGLRFDDLGKCHRPDCDIDCRRSHSDPGDQYLQDYALVRGSQRWPALCQTGSLGNQIPGCLDGCRFFSGRVEDGGSIPQQHTDPVFHNCFEVSRRDPARGTWGLRPAALDQRLADKIAVASALLVGVGWRHPVSALIIDETGEQAG